MSDDGERAREPAAVGGGWPPPHPSPPLPPPREYGAPGTPPRRAPYVVGAAVLAVVVVVALLVVLLGGDDGDAADRAADDPTTSAATESASETPAPAFTCWDGTGAAALEECSLPEGAAGLAWVFPQLSLSRCGEPTRTGPGVEVRILCTARFSDGSRIQLGYYQWQSVEAGVDFYEEQGLDPADAEGFHSWTGRDGSGTLKSALLYVDAPFSQTVTLPADARASEADLAALQRRPPEQVRGQPAP